MRVPKPRPGAPSQSHPSPPTSPSPSPPPPPSRAPPPDPKPKFKAEFFIDLKTDSSNKRRKRIKVVGDTGCSKSAMSEEFFLSSPHLRSRPYRPLTTRGTAINGSKVLTMGIVNVAFRINGRFYSMNFRVVKGLIQNVFLGWDWFSSAGAVMNAEKGVIEFPRFGDSTPLIDSSLEISGCYYRIPEDFVIPANSKAHLKVEVMLDGHDSPHVSNLVCTEPFVNTSSDVWACRCTDYVEDGLFMTELLNCNDYPVKMEKGRVLGFAKFTSEEELLGETAETDMYCQYDGDDSGYESNGALSEVESDRESDADSDCEEIQCDPPP